MLFHSIAWTDRPSASSGLGGRRRGQPLRMTLKTWLRNGCGYQDPPHKAPQHSANARPHIQPTEPTAQLLPPVVLMLLLGLVRQTLAPQVQTSPRQPSAHWGPLGTLDPLVHRHIMHRAPQRLSGQHWRGTLSCTRAARGAAPMPGGWLTPGGEKWLGPPRGCRGGGKGDREGQRRRESEKRRLARAAGYVPVAQVHNMIERIVRIGAVSGDKAGQRAQRTTDMDALK